MTRGILTCKSKSVAIGYCNSHTDVVCIDIVIHRSKFDSTVIIGQDVGVAILGPVLREKRGVLAMVHTN